MTFGVHARQYQLALDLLGRGWQSLDVLVRESGLPRRSVEEFLDGLGDDVERDGTAWRWSPRQDRPVPRAAATLPGDALKWLTHRIENVPPPLPALDHVQATPETVLERARWLDERYDLGALAVTFLGDHDLTSLAVRYLRPDADLTVVDVDDRVLAYLDAESGHTIRTIHADLRFGLPRAATGQADLVFSDPPYTPEGMALFAGRAVECLADPPRGRILLAYGYSHRHPKLGHQVQRALLNLGLTFEAVLPGFHRYAGAQAIGSRADLYVCQPTAAAKKKSAGRKTIYTHGPQSVEATRTPAPVRDAVAAIAGQDGLTVVEREPDWSRPITADEGTAVVLDCAGDPGPWLVRVLLAVNAERVAVLSPNAHPDLVDATAQAALNAVLAPKYRLRLLRSTPDNTHAVVVAHRIHDDDIPWTLWNRAHGRIGNIAPEAPSAVADLRLIDLPRHRISELLHHLRSTSRP